MLPRYLISFAVLALVFSAAYGAATLRKNEDSDLTDELIQWLEQAIEDEDNKYDGIVWSVILKIIRLLAGIATRNCIKKIVAECPHTVKEFLPCAIQYIQDHKLECFKPDGQSESSYFNMMTKEMAF